MSKKNIIFWILIIALAILGRFFYFWIIMPALFGIVVFYSIQFYKSKLCLVYPAIIVGTLCLCFSAGEFYFWEPPHDYELKNVASVEYLGSNPYQSNWYGDPVLGYGAKAIVAKTSNRNIKGDLVIYDVLYTTDEKGRRITPDNQSTADTLILLFGCSFTVGEGLEDHETFAWQLSELLGPKFQVYNYGFHGYGSHHMLALLESNRLDDLKNEYKNVYAYYLSFPSIEQRSGGIAQWGGPNTPKYVLDESGLAVRKGTLEEHRTPLRGKFARSLLLVNIFRIYDNRGLGFRSLDRYLLDLHAGIIKGSARVFYDKFGSTDFTAVVYPGYDEFKKRLVISDIGIIDMANHFEDYPSEKYEIPHDGHPSYEATKVIAKAYYEDIMEKMKKL